MSIKDAEATLQLAERKKVLVIVDHINLFNPAFRRLKKIADTSGPIDSINSIGGKWGPFRKDTPVLWDWGPHDVAMVLNILERTPVKVEAKQVKRKTTHDTFGELLYLKLFFENNIESKILIGNIFNKK